MKTIKKQTKTELIIKNSKFITLLYPATTEKEIHSHINNCKLTYPKANHYCYAYIMKDHKKSSDDKEPSGSAGIPMLTTLEKEDMYNILAIVIRYFGGIKLGAGGLIRAYRKAVKLALKEAECITMVESYKCSLTISYENEKNIKSLLKETKIIDTSYLETITYTLLIPKNNPLLQHKNIKIIEKTYMEKLE